MNIEYFRDIVTPYTMTSQSRIGYLFDSLEYVRNKNIIGDFVECGVWKGGNIFGILEYLNYYKLTDSNVWLYDTFEGMTSPEDIDVDLNNNKASDILHKVLCRSPLEEVKNLLNLSSYPKEKVKYVIGDVANTLLIEENIPKKIALLRLDTDWYQSTKIELEVLWDRLEPGAPCIIDDYGHWNGCRKAVNEFFEKLQKNYKCDIIDYTAMRIFKN